VQLFPSFFVGICRDPVFGIMLVGMVKVTAFLLLRVSISLVSKLTDENPMDTLKARIKHEHVA